MAPILDLNLISLQRQDGKENPSHPGLYMASPPKRPGRGRSSDLLVIYLAIHGNSPMDERSQEQMLERLTQIYYKTSGSVTFALKTVADQLNKILLDRNLRTTSTGRQGIGLLTMAVLKEERLTMAFCGPSHAYLVQAEQTQHFHDPQTAGRGLGLTRSISVRFIQATLKPNDILVMTPHPPGSWTEASLQNIHGQGIETLRRRLLAQVGPNLNAFVAYAQAGTGKLRLIRSQTAVQMVQPSGERIDEADKNKVEIPRKKPTASHQPPAPAERKEPAGPVSRAGLSQTDELDFLEPFDLPPKTQEVAGPSPEAPFSAALVEPEKGDKEVGSSKTGEGASFPQEIVEGRHAFPVSDQIDPVQFDSEKTVETPPQKSKPEPKIKGPGVLASLLTPVQNRLKIFLSFLSTHFGILGSYIHAASRWFARLLLSLLKRILPDESIFSIPAATMAFTAVAVAVVIATAGAVMYFQKGRAAQYQSFYEQAVSASETARGQVDPIELRTAWDTTIFYINKADAYKITSEANALRKTAQQALDELDYIQRLAFKSTFVGGLGNTANITRLASTHNELFMFNSNGGNVLRATLTGNGYTIDSSFNCSPNPTIGDIVDIAVLPQGNPLKASIMAMDTHGNLMLCTHGEAPKMTALAPPHSGWGSPGALVLDQNHLYVLDSPKNAVWIYWNMDFTNPPHLFFDERVPQMDDVVDLAVNRDDLYLLHGDGRTTTCKYSRLRESPTRCDDPAAYSDPRPGKQSGVYILDAQFQQILYSPSPDSSLYMLDPNNLAVFHFSLRLNLQRQFRSGNRLSGDTASAFAVSPNRTLFLATGSHVYYTQMP
jgi:hypothetical protein